ncbi:hypothetical protein SERLA73DRAFT_126064 [Serpula lacrymans var. lacrymans S7.3]|uniref:Uncharacterized protein n=2 Tax=Serpula lacrymans var. lacrymans TaxID=341189 RepID=F8QBK8_SERL3|nr:uncharacterized protein SERLADRAFT_374117 [Serpula lacrymans var. lacrymans S7.9]EGN94594.1 hypothetical protein SERLA73DRAFT_126064 [Serpula lacrymans var. lacrymans S7.3]EGO20072.1 hypothetical protein SERLADRAFT_374117 [Serpula lacrymans var. lacrymans S7.9]
MTGDVNVKVKGIVGSLQTFDSGRWNLAVLGTFILKDLIGDAADDNNPKTLLGRMAWVYEIDL